MNQVVVTGLGAVSPVGQSTDTYWAALVAGRSGFGPPTLYAADRLNAKMVAEVRDFVPADHFDVRQIGTLPPPRLIHGGIVLQCLAEGGRGTTRVRQARLEALPGFRIPVPMEGCRKGHCIGFHRVRRSVPHRDGFGEEVGGERFRQHAVRQLAAEV